MQVSKEYTETPDGEADDLDEAGNLVFTDAVLYHLHNLP
jgi:hypothetical protein